MREKGSTLRCAQEVEQLMFAVELNQVIRTACLRVMSLKWALKLLD